MSSLNIYPCEPLYQKWGFRGGGGVNVHGHDSKMLSEVVLLVTSAVLDIVFIQWATLWHFIMPPELPSHKASRGTDKLVSLKRIPRQIYCVELLYAIYLHLL